MTIASVRGATTLDKKSVLDAIAEFQDSRGFKPFAGASSLHAVDRVGSHLTNARCMLLMLSAALTDSDALHTRGTSSEFQATAPAIFAGAIDGVADLLDLSALLLDAGA